MIFGFMTENMEMWNDIICEQLLTNWINKPFNAETVFVLLIF